MLYSVESRCPEMGVYSKFTGRNGDANMGAVEVGYCPHSIRVG